MASPTQWTWIWVNSWSWWWTGRPGVLQSTGSPRVRHDLATELNWTEIYLDIQGCRSSFRVNNNPSLLLFLFSLMFFRRKGNLLLGTTEFIGFPRGPDSAEQCILPDSAEQCIFFSGDWKIEGNIRHKWHSAGSANWTLAVIWEIQEDTEWPGFGEVTLICRWVKNRHLNPWLLTCPLALQ